MFSPWRERHRVLNKCRAPAPRNQSLYALSSCTTTISLHRVNAWVFSIGSWTHNRRRLCGCSLLDENRFANRTVVAAVLEYIGSGLSEETTGREALSLRRELTLRIAMISRLGPSQTIKCISYCTLRGGSTYRCQERLSNEASSCVQLKIFSIPVKFFTFEQHTKSFISDISLSTSSMNCIMKSTNLCFSISSVCVFVIRKDIS